jgi:uncharacterized membrane protein YfcA
MDIPRSEAESAAVIWLELAAIGIVAGFLAGYLGIGGGLVMVPALTWLFGRDPVTAPLAVHMAVATSLSTMLVTSLSSIIAHQRRGAVLWQTVLRMTPGLLLGAVVGAWLADRLQTQQLALVFGLFALVAGLQLILDRRPQAHRPLPGWQSTGAVSSLIGLISSMVGVGGGSMTAPWLMWHGVRAQSAVATAAACGYPIALAGTASFVVLGNGAGSGAGSGTLGYVSLQAFAGIAVFSMLTAPLGAAAVHRSPPALVRRLFGGMMLLVALKMLL